MTEDKWDKRLSVIEVTLKQMNKSFVELRDHMYRDMKTTVDLGITPLRQEVERAINHQEKNEQKFAELESKIEKLGESQVELERRLTKDIEEKTEKTENRINMIIFSALASLVMTGIGMFVWLIQNGAN